MQTAKNYLQQPYARIVIPVENSGFHAEILEFPGCFAQGETLEEAYSNLEKAAESWIEVCLSQGHKVPEPSSSLTFSGRIVLRLPRSIHQKAAQLAERDQISLNTYLVSAVSARVGAEDLYNELTQKLEQRLVQAAYYAYYQFDTQTAEEKKTIRPLFITERASTATANKQPKLLNARR
jgi:predicted RNase H-like HicB family nuclease